MSHLSTEQYQNQVKAVWRATVWLAFLTIIEVGGALLYPEEAPVIILNIFFIVATLLKAFFIVGEFMHLKYEFRALVITVLSPMFFLIWFIIAFLWEGAHWLNLRQFWETFGG